LEDEQNSGQGPGAETLGFAPGSRVSGRPSIPRSKSLAQRYLVCASLTGEPARLTGLEGGEDIAAAVALLEALGLAEADGPGALRIRAGQGAWKRIAGPIELGESGTLARLVTAVAALCADSQRVLELVPRGSLGTRSSPALFAALREAGASLDDEQGKPTNGWPVCVRAAVHASGQPARVRLVEPSSSQEVSGLLIALAASGGELEVVGAIPSRPYLALTHSALERHGVQVTERKTDKGSRFLLQGELRSPGELDVEPDASAAAVALAAGCLSGGDVSVEGLGAANGTRQGDVRIVEYLARAGCRAESAGASLRASGAPTRAFEVDLTGEPDLAPVLAAIAARAVLESPESEARCVLRGLETLPGKESSRIEVLARGLTELGFETRHDERSLSVGRGRAAERGPGSAEAGSRVILDPENDHRMAFCFALCSLFLPGVLVRNASCVGKSWPGFWANLADSGARLESA
jgi:3-phosphoshikimate 1-carboxyvinyltransferase